MLALYPELGHSPCQGLQECWKVGAAWQRCTTCEPLSVWEDGEGNRRQVTRHGHCGGKKMGSDSSERTGECAWALRKGPEFKTSMWEACGRSV